MINESTVPSFYDLSKTVQLNEIGFRFAWSARNVFSKELIDDQRYVKWIVRKRMSRNNKESEILLPYHKCTDSDYE